MKTKFFMVATFMFLNSIFFGASSAEEESLLEHLSGEWISQCQFDQSSYSKSTRAYIGNRMIHSWKWYSSFSQCEKEENAEGEYWDSWEVVIQNSAEADEDTVVLTQKEKLIDGYKKQCPLDIYPIQIFGQGQERLYFSGELFDCYTQGEDQGFFFPSPNSSSRSYGSFTFHREIDQSYDEYIATLKREWDEEE